MRPEDTEMASGEVADEELADMTLEELLSDLPENHPITKAVRTLELEAADLRERLAKAREEAVRGPKIAQVIGRTEGMDYALTIPTTYITDKGVGIVVEIPKIALSQKGADHE